MPRDHIVFFWLHRIDFPHQSNNTIRDCMIVDLHKCDEMLSGVAGVIVAVSSYKKFLAIFFSIINTSNILTLQMMQIYALPR